MLAADSAACRTERVEQHARAVGFDLFGVAPTTAPGPAYQRYERCAADGYFEHLPWMTESPELRRDVRAVHPSARSVVVVGVGYWSDTPGYLAEPPAPDRGWIARYAQGKDYHLRVRRMLIRLARRVADDPELPGDTSTEHRVFVDTGPVLERAYAARAGLGWIGKNTMLINRERGSWYFLGVLLTPLELAPTEAERDRCGGCTRCIDICPTGAIVEPYRVDPRRCIATWTIEAEDPRAVIEPEKLGQHVFGCDLCQEVCPWNGKAVETRQDPLRPRPANVRPRLDELAELDEAAFKARFPRSAVRRTDAERMAAVARAILARNGLDSSG